MQEQDLMKLNDVLLEEVCKWCEGRGKMKGMDGVCCYCGSVKGVKLTNEGHDLINWFLRHMKIKSEFGKM